MYLCKRLTIPCRRQWHPTPVLLPEKSHGRRSLVGCSPWGCEESDTSERLHFHISLLCIGEGNGNQLQCSCLENPRDGGAWRAAVYGVAQSRTRLKRLSSKGEKGGRSKLWVWDWQIQITMYKIDSMWLRATLSLCSRAHALSKRSHLSDKCAPQVEGSPHVAMKTPLKFFFLIKKTFSSMPGP